MNLPRLHPTPFGFFLGILVIAFSMGLWLWMLVQLPAPQEATKQLRRYPPMASSAAQRTSTRA